MCDLQEFVLSKRKRKVKKVILIMRTVLTILTKSLTNCVKNRFVLLVVKIKASRGQNWSQASIQ